MFAYMSRMMSRWLRSALHQACRKRLRRLMSAFGTFLPVADLPMDGRCQGDSVAKLFWHA